METGKEAVIIILMTLESLEPAPVMPINMEYKRQTVMVLYIQNSKDISNHLNLRGKNKG